MTTILMIAALVLIAGLFLWLSTTAQPTQIAVVEEPDSAADADAMDGDVADVTLAEFATGPQGFQSLSIRLRDVAVASTLGARNFWIQLPNNRPYLIHIGEDLAASGASVVNGDTVTVAGTVHLMGDSTLTAWRSSGVLTDDLQVEEARFATSYLDARAIR
jgi:hypothetical protein